MFAEKMGEKAVVQNCDIKFRMKCPLSWDALGTTDDEATRYYSICERSVFLCTTNEDAVSHARRGECIAVTMIDEEGLPAFTFGEPEEPDPDPTKDQLELLDRY